MIPPAQVASFKRAFPYGVSFLLVPILWLAVTRGGWFLLLPPAAAWWAFSLFDALLGRDTENPDPETPESGLWLYKLVTWAWVPVQLVTLYGALWMVTRSELTTFERIVAMFDVGVITGSVGIVYAHELMHRGSRFERWLGDILMASVLYSHFRTEHLLVHHPWVGTGRDAVTARYNEGFHRFFFRVLTTGPGSAWRAETQRLARRGLSRFDAANPFWRYLALQALALEAALLVGGWEGVALFFVQAFVAIWLLELTNYVEHYGLVRRYLGNGRYEPTRPHHSWNADHRATNWQLINLQRHSDHHYKPARRYPLLQTYPASEAPQLPFGYPLMTLMAMVPPLWRRVMNPRVRKWRAMHYPEIKDWRPYRRLEHPDPTER